jgi:hypothetical protein
VSAHEVARLRASLAAAERDRDGYNQQQGEYREQRDMALARAAAAEARERDAKAAGLDMAADLLASWWDDGEQNPPGFDPQKAAEVVLLRKQAKRMRQTGSAAPAEPQGSGPEDEGWTRPYNLGWQHALDFAQVHGMTLARAEGAARRTSGGKPCPCGSEHPMETCTGCRNAEAVEDGLCDACRKERAP